MSFSICAKNVCSEVFRPESSAVCSQGPWLPAALSEITTLFTVCAAFRAHQGGAACRKPRSDNAGLMLVGSAQPPLAGGTGLTEGKIGLYRFNVL